MIENDVESCDTDLLEGLQNLKCFIESIEWNSLLCIFIV